jgi:hypothetical protein
MNKKEVKRLAEKYLETTIDIYGFSKYQYSSPYIVIEDSPYDDAEDKSMTGEYIHDDNELVIYWKNVRDGVELARTIIHEYQHYLQSPKWMTRYYNMGYTYNNHPYEIQANIEENKNWKKVCK